MSNPKTHPTPARGYTLSLRLTDEEHAQLLHYAGDLSFSAYTRQCLFGEATNKRKRRAKKLPADVTTQLTQILGKIGRARWSSNLNQLSKAANCGNFILTPEVKSLILEACADIREIKTLLLKALGMAG